MTFYVHPNRVEEVKKLFPNAEVLGVNRFVDEGAWCAYISHDDVDSIEKVFSITVK